MLSPIKKQSPRKIISLMTLAACPLLFGNSPVTYRPSVPVPVVRDETQFPAAIRYKTNVYVCEWDHTSKFPVSLGAIKSDFYVRTFYLDAGILRKADTRLAGRKKIKAPDYMDLKMVCEVYRLTDTLRLALSKEEFAYKHKFYPTQSEDIAFMKTFLTKEQVKRYFP